MKKICLLVILLLVACNEKAAYQFQLQGDETFAKADVERILKEHDIDKAEILKLDNEIVVAAQVKPFKRFQKQSIEKKLKKSLEKTFNQHDIFVSTDYKIWLELQKLDNANKKEISELKSLAEEET